ncbi:MAG: vitamin K epoxide reductase family protein [Patescibacteria group bacterium]|jgi:uncharacterized membrane protein
MLYPAIIVLSIIGFFISRHIYRAKKTGVKLVCHFGAGKQSCNEVVESEYGKTFGIPNEVVGMVYYLAVMIVAALFLIFPVLAYEVAKTGFFAVSALAFALSAYLTGIQAFVLKKFCEWCLATALVNTLIFALTAFAFYF